MTIRYVIAVAACGLGLAACSSSNADMSWAPSWAAFSPKPTTVSITIESEPPGAEARTTQGLTCLTPCTLSVPPSGEFGVSYTLAGYAPQSVSVRPVELEPSKFGPPPVPGFTPNPVRAELKPVVEGVVPAQRKKKKDGLAATAALATPRVSRAATAPPAAPPNVSPMVTITPRAPVATAAPPAAPSSNAAPTAPVAVAKPAVTSDPGAAPPPVFSTQGSLGPPAGVFTPIPGTIR